MKQMKRLMVRAAGAVLRQKHTAGGKFRALILVGLWFGLAARAMAGTGPHVFLGETNTTGAGLLQEDFSYDGVTVYNETLDCRRTDPPNGHHFMYFKLDDDYIFNGSYPIVHVAVRLYDSGTGPFVLQYESSDEKFQSVTKYRTNTGGWKWFTFDVDNAKFANGQQGQFDFRLSDAGSSALNVKSVYVWCRKENAGVVSVDSGELRLGGVRFVMVGANYIAPWMTIWADWSQMWGTYYDPALIERDMTQMEKAGVNSIRTFLDFSDYICPSKGNLNSTVISHVQDFLGRARDHGLKITFHVGGSPSWLGTQAINDYGGIKNGDSWTNFEIRKGKADFLVQLINAAGLGDYDSFLGFDLANEPSFAKWNGTSQDFYDSLTVNSPATLRAWNRWVNQKYGSLTNAYTVWGYTGPSDTLSAVYPEAESHFTSSGGWDKKIDDYYAFVADSFVETTGYIHNRVKTEALDRTLFTINFVIRGISDSLTSDIYTTRLLTGDAKRLSAACDFVSLHIYGGYSLDESWYQDRLIDLLALGMDKPVVLSEFGRFASSTNDTELEIQRVLWKGFMDLAATAKIDGCLGWMWNDPVCSTNPTPRQDFGLRSVTDVAKPAYNEFLQGKSSILIKNEPVPTCVVDVDVDSFISPLEVFYAGGRSLITNLVMGLGHYPDMISGRREPPLIDRIYHLPVQANDPVVGSLGIDDDYGAVLVEDTIPDFMVGGMSYPCKVSVMNVGTNIWTKNDNYRLGTTDTYFGSGGRWFLGDSEAIANNQIKTFNLTLMPPNTAGTFTYPWRMLQEYVKWFGEKHEHVIKVVAAPPRGARIISHTIPSVIAANSLASVTVTVRNEGTNTWTMNDNYKLGAVGNSDPFAINRSLLASGDAIASGQTKTFTFTMTAPSTPGCYQSDWQMLQEGVVWFGQKIDVEIMVE